MGDSKKLPLLNNSRFYVLTSIVCLAAFTICLLRVVIPSSQLWTIRSEQALGLGALILWYVTLLLGPLRKFLGEKPWIAVLVYNRRPLGVSVAILALLHASFAFWGQLSGFSGLGVLPALFVWALLFGLAGLLILLAMTAISVDSIFRKSPKIAIFIFAKLSYVAVVGTLLHVWLIGTHVSNSLIQITAFVLLLVMFGAQVASSVKSRVDHGGHVRESIANGCIIFALILAGLLLVKIALPSYAQQHQGHTEGGGAGHAGH